MGPTAIYSKSARMTHPKPASPYEALLNPVLFPSYQIHNAKEILRLMRTLAEKRILLTAYLDGGPFLFMTAVLGVTNDGQIILDASADEKMNQRAAEAETLTCTGRLDGVRIQFSVSGTVRFPHDGLEAILCPLPLSVLRLQRREFYRLPVPISNPVKCTIFLNNEDGSKRAVMVRVVDISNDGIGVIAAIDDLVFEPGQIFEHCALSVPESDATDVALQLRNVYRIDNRFGGQSQRAGCQFLGLTNHMVTKIQRYIFKMERERRTLETND